MAALILLKSCCETYLITTECDESCHLKTEGFVPQMATHAHTGAQWQVCLLEHTAITLQVAKVKGASGQRREVQGDPGESRRTLGRAFPGHRGCLGACGGRRTPELPLSSHTDRLYCMPDAFPGSAPSERPLSSVLG